MERCTLATRRHPLMRIFESELRNKSVMSDDGSYLGTVRNATVNTKTGDLVHVLVEPSDSIDSRLYERDKNGFLLFPSKNVRSVSNFVVVRAS
jgi:sporulation protein YlmC with PRC-barrel domain